MSGIKAVLALSLATVTGLTLLVMGCAIPAFDSWWPIIVIVFYVLAPLPVMLAKHYQMSSSGTSSALEFAIFCTAGIVLSSFALPYVLAHRGVISYGAYFFVFLANAVIFSSIYGIYKYFRGDFEGASMF